MGSTGQLVINLWGMIDCMWSMGEQYWSTYHQSCQHCCSASNYHALNHTRSYYIYTNSNLKVDESGTSSWTQTLINVAYLSINNNFLHLSSFSCSQGLRLNFAKLGRFNRILYECQHLIKEVRAHGLHLFRPGQHLL